VKTTVLDSYALLAYFEKEAGWHTVAQLLAAADCFAAGLAKRTDGDLLTGDPEFETLSDDVPVRWLA
jgi:PIN domain nuclease of toxin-antitoxin system